MARVPYDGKVRYATGEEVVVGDKIQTEHEGAGFVTHVAYATDTDLEKWHRGTGIAIVCDSFDRASFVVEYGSTAWEHLVFIYREDRTAKPHLGQGMSFICVIAVQDDDQWNLSVERLVGQVEAELVRLGATQVRRTHPQWKVGGRRSLALRVHQDPWEWVLLFNPATPTELIAISTSPGKQKLRWTDLNDRRGALIRVNEWLESLLQRVPEVELKEILTLDHWTQRMTGLL